MCMWHVQHLLIRNTLDVMHVEKNVAENILKTILRMGDKDSIKVREDMKELGIKQSLWPRRCENDTKKIFLPYAPYTFTKQGKETFFSIVKYMKTPTGYSASMRKHIAGYFILNLFYCML